MYNKHNFNSMRALPGASHYHGGMLVEPKATVCTDGHALIKVTAPEGDVADYPDAENALREFESFVISRENALAAGELASKVGRPFMPILKNIILTALNGSKRWAWGLATERKELSCVVEDQKFPNYENIFPKQAPLQTVVFDGKILAPLVKFLADLGTTSSKNHAALRLSLYSPESKGIMKIEVKNADTGQLGAVLVMPMSPKSFE